MEATLRFELRQDKVNKRGEHPVILVLRVEGQRRKIATGVTLLPELWDNDSQKITTLTQKLKEQLAKKHGKNIPVKSQLVQYQDILNSLVSRVRTIEYKYVFDGFSYSADMIVEALKETNVNKVRKEDSTNLIYDFIDQYVAENELTRARGSLMVYKSLKKYLQGYELKMRTKLTFDKIDYSFMQSFQNFLINWKEVNKKTKRVKTINNITIAKQLSTLKTIMGYAKRNGIEVNNGYRDFSIKKDKLEVIALTQEEFDMLVALDLNNDKRLDQVRDVFCFSCATGFRYSDLEQLKRGHIKDIEIRLTVNKTKEPLIVPLNWFSKSILDKYKEQVSPLPIISNQKFNKYLKELCKKAEINDPIEIIRYKGAVKESKIYPKHEIISSHTGRKTFATLSLEKGIPAETVMKITGHSDYKSFQRYVKVTEERKRNEMQRAWGAPA